MNRIHDENQYTLDSTEREALFILQCRIKMKDKTYIELENKGLRSIENQTRTRTRTSARTRTRTRTNTRLPLERHS
jgi:hypothetical protein